MSTRRQFDPSFGLAATEMQVVLVVRNLAVERRQFRVDEHVMMAGVGLVDPGGCHSGPRQSHAEPEFAATDDLSVARPNDVDLGTFRRRLGLGAEVPRKQ